MVTKGSQSDETTLLRAFRFTDLSNSGYITPDGFLRALTKLGVNLVNSDNVLEYFNLYDKAHNGKINYKELITEIYSPLEIKRRNIMKEEKELQGSGKKSGKEKFNLISTKFKQKIEQNLEKNTNFIKKLKNEILSQGINTIFDLEKSLKKIDVDNSGKVDLDEFNRVISENGINLTPDDIKLVFSCFDPSRNGKIYYEDFINIIIDDMNEKRRNLINEIFYKNNRNEKGNLDMKTFFNLINATKLGEDRTDEFKDNFTTHHDYMGKDNGGDISYGEFLNFFKIISMYHKEDFEFENFIKNIFNLKSDDKGQSRDFLESFEKLKKLIIELGSNGIIELLRNYKAVDPSNTAKLDYEEFNEVIKNTLKGKIKLITKEELQLIFSIYDTNNENVIEFPKFISEILDMKSMSQSRKEHLKKIFEHIDYEGKQSLDINELITLYKTPSNSMNPIPDLIDSLITYHHIERGNRNPLISLDDFIKFYNYINILIPETKNDKLFIEYTSETWPLYDKTFEERKNMVKIDGEGLGKQKNRNALQKFQPEQKVPFGVIKDKINYNLNDNNAMIKYNVNKLDDIVSHLRDDLIHKGILGILSMRRNFILLDENSSKTIDFKEFKKYFKKFRYSLSDVEIQNLFNFFDKEHTGFIQYDEFIQHICGNLSKFRTNLLKQVFESIDKNEKGYITVGEMREGFTPSAHPLVRQGKRAEDEILGEFLDILEYHFNLLFEKNEDESDVNDIKVDFDEFCEFYKNISICIEDDKYFEVMLLSVWGIKKDGKTLYQRTWNKQDL